MDWYATDRISSIFFMMAVDEKRESDFNGLQKKGKKEGKIIPSTFFLSSLSFFNLLPPSLLREANTTKRFTNLHFYFFKMMLAQTGIKVNLRLCRVREATQICVNKKAEQLEILLALTQCDLQTDCGQFISTCFVSFLSFLWMWHFPVCFIFLFYALHRKKGLCKSTWVFLLSVNDSSEKKLWRKGVRRRKAENYRDLKSTLEKRRNVGWRVN